MNRYNLAFIAVAFLLGISLGLAIGTRFSNRYEFRSVHFIADNSISANWVIKCDRWTGKVVKEPVQPPRR